MNPRAPVLQVRDLAVHFRVDTGSLFRHDYRVVRAVDNVSFDVHSAETLGVVGESGCGKSTLARAILGLVRAQGGSILWQGEDLVGLSEEALRLKRREIQLIFQDPSGSLDPRMTVGEIVAEPLKVFYPSMSRLQIRERVAGMMKMVGLSAEQINRYPHEFSGGQCQRIGIARALVVNPRLVVCDEPVSALDVSIQAQIIALLRKLCDDTGTAVMLVTHDMGVIAEACDRVAVLYAGRVAELGPVRDVLTAPRHPYSRGLIASIPRLRARLEMLPQIPGTMPRLDSLPAGCAFAPRCPFVMERCKTERPEATVRTDGVQIACWLEEGQ